MFHLLKMKAYLCFFSASFLLTWSCTCNDQPLESKQQAPRSPTLVYPKFLNQIEMGVSVDDFRRAATLLLHLNSQQIEPRHQFHCRSQVDLLAPSVEKRVMEQFVAGEHALEFCQLTPRQFGQSSTLVHLKGEFVDNQLVKLSFVFASSEKKRIAEELIYKWGKGESYNIEDLSIPGINNVNTYIIWQPNREMLLLSEGAGGNPTVVRIDLARCQTLSRRPSHNVRGHPISLDDLGIGNLDLDAALPEVEFNDGGILIAP